MGGQLNEREEGRGKKERRRGESFRGRRKEEKEKEKERCSVGTCVGVSLEEKDREHGEDTPLSIPRLGWEVHRFTERTTAKKEELFGAPPHRLSPFAHPA